ncbi:MAG: hypothetical protein AAGA34_03355 [Pseudomonadota bacterium]
MQDHEINIDKINWFLQAFAEDFCSLQFCLDYFICQNNVTLDELNFYLSYLIGKNYLKFTIFDFSSFVETDFYMSDNWQIAQISSMALEDKDKFQKRGLSITPEGLAHFCSSIR